MSSLWRHKVYLFRSFILHWIWHMLNDKRVKAYQCCYFRSCSHTHALVTVKLASKANDDAPWSSNSAFSRKTIRSCCTRHEVTELASKLTLLAWKSMRRIHLQASYRPYSYKPFCSVLRFPRRNFASGATLPSFLRMGLHFSATRSSWKVCQFFRPNALGCICHWKSSCHFFSN